MSAALRHSWWPPDRSQYKTERECRRCRTIKVTDHSGPLPFIYFFSHPVDGVPGERINGPKTPPCTGQSDVSDLPDSKQPISGKPDIGGPAGGLDSRGNPKLQQEAISP